MKIPRRTGHGPSNFIPEAEVRSSLPFPLGLSVTPASGVHFLPSFESAYTFPVCLSYYSTLGDRISSCRGLRQRRQLLGSGNCNRYTAGMITRVLQRACDVPNGGTVAYSSNINVCLPNKMDQCILCRASVFVRVVSSVESSLLNLWLTSYRGNFHLCSVCRVYVCVCFGNSGIGQHLG